MAEVKCIKCGKVSKSLQGWKHHMSGAHGGYDESDIRAATGLNNPSANVQDRMNRFAETLSVPVETTVDSGEKTASTSTQQPEPAPQPEGKRIKATPKRLKKILGDIPSQILTAQGIALDSDDSEAMEEAAEFLAGVFGIEFMVPESKYVVKSRFAAILWVVGVTLLVWAKHKTPEIWKFISEGGKQKTKETSKSNVEQNHGSSRSVR